MPFRESRRSTRVPLRVAIAVESGAESLTCEGETVVVNLHGAVVRQNAGVSADLDAPWQNRRNDPLTGTRPAFGKKQDHLIPSSTALC
jgi:hypothetical protein